MTVPPSEVAALWDGSAASSTVGLPVGVAAPDDACWSAVQTRCGEHGISMSLMPSWRTASTTALTTAGVEAIVPASPTPLTPSALVGRRRLGAVGRERRQVGRARHEVVDERARHQGAGVVVHRLLEQRLRDALDEAAVHLALDDQRVDDLADVVDAGVVADLDLTGLGVDLDRAQVGAVREREVRRVERRIGVQ